MQDAQNWSRGKSLSDLDYQFLSASERCDRAIVQQALEAERAGAVERTAKLQRRLLAIATSAAIVTSVLGTVAFWQSRQATIGEVRALISAAKGNLASHQTLNALVDSIKAKRTLARLRQPPAKLRTPEGRLVRTIPAHDAAILDRVVSIDTVLEEGCDWVRDYLTTNERLEPSDRRLCHN